MRKYVDYPLAKCHFWGTLWAESYLNKAIRRSYATTTKFTKTNYRYKTER
jgi:hypothetical protein